MQYLDYLVIDNYCDQLILHENLQSIAKLCEIEKAYDKRTLICMRKRNEVLYSRGGNSPNKKISNALDISCILPFKQLVIRPSGHISLCSNDTLGEMTLGDANVKSLTDIWYSEEYMKLRKQIATGRKSCLLCRRCDSLFHPNKY